MKTNLISLHHIPQDPYPELRDVLRIFAIKVSNCLSDNLIGIYLVGSLATGDFDLNSDVDFLVVINKELNNYQIKSLQDIQSRIYEMPYYPAKHLEGSFITLEDLNIADTIGIRQLYYFDNGNTTFEQSIHDNNWHVRWILREKGIPLIGPAPETLVNPVPIEKLRNEIRNIIFEIKALFEAEIDRPLSFLNSEFGQSFIVLTYCRMLHTLQTGTIQSKKAAANWAVTNFDHDWKQFIMQAWQARGGVRFGGKIGIKTSPDLLYATLDFIKYCIIQVADHRL